MIDSHAENENTIIADLLSHLDIGAIERTNSQRTVQLK